MNTKPKTKEDEFPGQLRIMKAILVAKGLFAVEQPTREMIDGVKSFLFFDDGEEDEDAEEQLKLSLELAKETFQVEAPEPWQVFMSYQEEFLEE